MSQPSPTPRRATVSSFDELVQRPLAHGVNALRWPRALPGDFRELAHHLVPSEGVRVVDTDTLVRLSLSPAGRTAADAVLTDLQRLEALGRDPVLNCIADYARDERGLPIATDVFSFHVDRAPTEVETWLCTYWGKPSEGLDNDHAARLVDDATVRAQLLQHFGGADDHGFREWLRDESFDLHYRMNGTAPFSFSVADLWKIAVEWPGCAVPPCIHRAPRTVPGDEPRLMLIC
jgi:hypothetical protein